MERSEIWGEILKAFPAFHCAHADYLPTQKGVIEDSMAQIRRNSGRWASKSMSMRRR
jgi:hypothetical protein